MGQILWRSWVLHINVSSTFHSIATKDLYYIKATNPTKNNKQIFLKSEKVLSFILVNFSFIHN